MPYFLEAEYESGYVHRQDEQDHSPYVRYKNIFHDILNRLPESAHGKMVRYSLVGDEETHTIDWTTLPDNARPIHVMTMERDINTDGTAGDTRCVGRKFGYQYTDENGKNIKEVKEL